ncbi:urea ABC transporter permease subunit UrtC [Marinomonas mediterranea]|jgi:amino acid/amide ABC transporter membrane protein 2, HAAT family (TC 3.A.1.4.-)|uniref:Urea ABC transporter, permease protein UrtC n=1 Tax=Marinomonas mediterranea (strain ATCC 700492 / JCM 21426 / NBRC 103028 / MMB-1) TaxID=717774 RepID=F2JVG4_MARM1|nr:urea ABC transporter permease subunit UrtC [Marinomonas mediterranea]ADZ89422.1 urea ABC transporter, permease protein UrtC [Marinomonas mediterranea MMB-1]WCN15679.1 urea ABC transporter permease subunit UrtC [Marinomonas mediterranea MMB-1]
MTKLLDWFSAGRTSGKYTLPFVVILLSITVLASAANLLLPQDSALYVSTYSITLLGKYLCYAMLALAVDIIWGYCGILSLGHGAFFALGGYAMGMYLMRQIGDRGVYSNPLLPDFMVFLDWKELPWFWLGMDQFWFAMLMAVIVPGLLAFVFGWLAFRSRVTGVYLSIMTQALTYALLLAFFRNEMGFGGNNGLTDFKEILGFDLQADATRVSLFLITAILLAGIFVLSQRILSSRLGKVTLAVRDAEARTRFIGYRTERYKVWLFVYSAVIAGIAGALYVPQVGIINPGEFSPINSIEIVIWVAVGGRGTLIGAIIGALLVNYAKTRFTAIMPDGWLFALGAMFVLVTLYLPKGLVGLYGQLTSKRGAKAKQEATS